ncbi:MAG: thiosulfate sulfurtransferase GlpE [Moraxellaceae bacterium]|nr:thiosulfate sulfurtransferase GlpE [Moraxellaceae bacterium]
MSWARIAPAAAQVLVAERSPAIVDVRDPASFAAGHLPGAVFLDNQSVSDFIEATAKERPVLVYCYHGNSSQSAAAWLASQGFTEVYSLDGGFEIWKLNGPVES